MWGNSWLAFEVSRESFCSNKCVTGGSNQQRFQLLMERVNIGCEETAAPTLKAVVIDVSYCGDALAKVRVEGVVAAQNSAFLHHPLRNHNRKHISRYMKQERG